MSENEFGVQQNSLRTRVMDRNINPPRYVDLELPVTKVLRHARRLGRERAPHGSAVGSIRFTGSHYDLGPGTYGMRITRVHVHMGTPGYSWGIWHSRKGTLDVLTTDPTPIGASRSIVTDFTLIGDQQRPVYSVGAGTLFWGFLGDATTAAGSAFWLVQNLEGVLSVKRPDDI